MNTVTQNGISILGYSLFNTCNKGLAVSKKQLIERLHNIQWRVKDLTLDTLIARFATIYI